MGIFDWLRKKSTSSDNDDEVQFDKGEEHFAGLNMKDAIDAHLAWFKKLERAIADKSAAGYEISTVAADNVCKLGTWVYKDAKPFKTLAEYEALRKAHADFHMMAGEILILIRDGEFDQATQRVRRDLRRASDHVQLALIRLCSRANNM